MSIRSIRKSKHGHPAYTLRRLAKNINRDQEADGFTGERYEALEKISREVWRRLAPLELAFYPGTVFATRFYA